MWLVIVIDQCHFRINLEYVAKLFSKMLDTQLGYLYLVSRADLLEVVMFLVELRFEQITVEEDCKVWCQRQPKASSSGCYSLWPRL